MKQEINIRKMLPFLGREVIDDLARSISEHGDMHKGVRLSDVIPFVSSGQLMLLVKQRQQEGKDIHMFYPYLPSDYYHKIVQDYTEGKEVDIDLNKAYPFMSDDDLHLLLQYALSQQEGSESQENPENDSQIVGTDISETVE